MSVDPDNWRNQFGPDGLGISLDELLQVRDLLRRVAALEQAA